MFGGSVLGLSSLRQHEPKSQEPSEHSKQLLAYLAKYKDEKAADPGKVKKKKKKAAPKQPTGIRVYEENNTGFRNHQAEEAAEDEEAPVVANPEEAERAIRQVQELQAGAMTDSWEEVPTVVGDIPIVGRAKSARPRHDSPDVSPPRRKRHDSRDASPPRKRRHASPDSSPPRRQRHDSPDMRPPRQEQATCDDSPPRRRRHDSPDASPPRRQRHDSPDASPPKRRRHDSPDASPYRLQRHDSPDASPPRRHRHDSPDASPPRRSKPSGAKLPAKHRGALDDLSPPRKRRGVSQQPNGTGPGGKPRFMPDGGRAGKVTGQQLAAELEAKAAKEAADFAAMGVQATGRGAETVYRDKAGKRVTLEELKAQQAANKNPVAETPVWGGGMAQQRAAEDRRQQMRAEAAKPFARRREDVDDLLKQRERFGDPMAHLVKKRPAVESSVIPAALQKKMKKAGFVIPQDVPAHSYLKRNLGPPGNRYNIRPGRHWDGVDRSTGFERDMFSIINARKNRAQEAHMWSQGDM